jgi:hypothetical protein
MIKDRANNGITEGIIGVFALADGVIHLALDFILFHGILIGNAFPAARPGGGVRRPGVPPGPRIQFPLPLNEMFLLNFIGSVILVWLLLSSGRWPQARRVLLDVVIIGYEAFTFVCWWLVGRPNPMELGYLSKGVEIVVIVAVIAHISSLLRSRGVAGTRLMVDR